MNNNPSNVHVLYANVKVKDAETNQKIQKLCDDIVEYFHKNGNNNKNIEKYIRTTQFFLGIMKKPPDFVKLHATVINSLHRKDVSKDKPWKRYRKRVSFDARPILKKYKDYYFGTQPLTTLHLSDKSSVDQTGYYGCDGSIVINNKCS